MLQPQLAPLPANLRKLRDGVALWLAGEKMADLLVILQLVFYEDRNDDV